MHVSLRSVTSRENIRSMPLWKGPLEHCFDNVTHTDSKDPRPEDFFVRGYV